MGDLTEFIKGLTEYINNTPTEQLEKELSELAERCGVTEITINDEADAEALCKQLIETLQQEKSVDEQAGK